jgi:hypothetical protein
MQSLPRRRRTCSWRVLLAVALAWCAAAGSARGVVIDFEGVPDEFNYAGQGLNLGDYYSALPGGPVFGRQTTVLEAGRGSFNEGLYPPQSGHGVLWGEREAIEVVFTTGWVSKVSFYYRSNTVLNLYAFDPGDVLLGGFSGPESLAPDYPGGLLSFHAGAYSIARVLIQDSGNFFVIDDFTYAVRGVAVPDSGATLLLGAMALGAVALLGCWGRMGGVG